MNSVAPEDRFKLPTITLDASGIYFKFRAAGKKKVKQVMILENKNDVEIIEYVTADGENASITRQVGSTYGEDIVKNADFVKIVRPKGHVVTFYFDTIQQTIDLGSDKDGAILDLLRKAVKFGVLKMKLPDFLK